MREQVLAILTAHGMELHALLARLTLRADIAEDLMQELFIKLDRTGVLERVSEPLAYIQRAAINLALDWRRAQRRQPELSLLAHEPAATEPSPLTALIHAEQVEQILNAAAELSGVYREAFILRHVRQESYEAIGCALGRSAHQVRALAHSAVQQLRRRLSDPRRKPARGGRAMMNERDILARMQEPAGAAPSEKAGQKAVNVTLGTLATEATRAYRGWVHVRLRLKQDIDSNPSRAAVQHMKPMDGTWVSEEECNGQRTLWLVSPACQEEAKYDSKTNELRLGAIGPAMAAGRAKQAAEYPLTLAAVLKSRDTASMTQSQEQGLTRFDVVFGGEAPCLKQASCSEQAAMPERVTIWVDPRTELIQKGEIHVQGQVVLAEYTYGEPEIRDLYDLGVPRDARVVDNRPTKDIQAISARLKRRIDAGYGESVAVLTATNANDPSDRYVSLSLFARSGNAWLANRYLVGERKYRDGSLRNAIGVPEGWPWPKLETILPLVQAASPSEYVGSDGTISWGGVVGFSSLETADPQSKDAGMLRHMAVTYDLPGKIWPDLSAMGAFGADARVQVLIDSTHPGQIGLQVERITFVRIHPPQKQRDVTIFWLDPARDDMPTERINRSYELDGKLAGIEFKTSYLEYRQLPDGRWYPCRWTSATTNHARPDAPVEVTDYRLQIAAGVKLGAEWFRNPMAGEAGGGRGE